MQKKNVVKPYVKQFYKGNRLNVAIVVFSLLLGMVVSMWISWLLQLIVDLISGVNIGFSFEEVVWLSVGLLLADAVFTTLKYFFLPRFMAKGMAQYKNYVYKKLSEKSVSAFSGENTSLYISALSNDTQVIKTGYLYNIFAIIYSALLLVSAIALMCYYSVILTVLSILFALLPFIAALATGNMMVTAEKTLSKKNQSYLETLKDSLIGFSVIKSFKAEAQMYRIFSNKIREAAKAEVTAQKRKILVQAIASASGNILQIGIFLVGAYFALSGGAISAGTAIVFVQLLNFVINPVQQIPQALAERKAAKALIEKLATALEENVREEGKTQKTELKNAIELRNITFGYKENKTVLNGVDFLFEKGKSYCVVGSSGSGKTTLLNMLTAANSIYSGAVYYDGTDLRDIASEALYEMVSVIQQNVFIFDASVRENITLFREFPKEEVERAVHLSGLSELIAERGEEYLCGENGKNLSGGEKQRIAIARSLLRKSQVLLVDEATASLDRETAFNVSSSLLALDGVTKIIVTHALEGGLLKKYDCILCMKNGRICEYGSFEELMERKGYFYSLYTVSQE